jgi:CBS domain-containing protein
LDLTFLFDSSVDYLGFQAMSQGRRVGEKSIRGRHEYRRLSDVRQPDGSRQLDLMTQPDVSASPDTSMAEVADTMAAACRPAQDRRGREGRRSGPIAAAPPLRPDRMVRGEPCATQRHARSIGGG